MQEILVDRVQVYEGWYHSHWEIGAMWVVTDYRGKEPVTETWSTGYPSDFHFPTTAGFDRENTKLFRYDVPGHSERTGRALQGFRPPGNELPRGGHHGGPSMLPGDQLILRAA